VPPPRIIPLIPERPALAHADTPGQPAAGLPGALPVKGRGTAWAVPHRFERQAREAVDDGWGSLAALAGVAPGSEPPGAGPATTVIDEPAGRILTANDSPDIPFDLSINPYRGCEHGCIYCFARPTHSYLNLSPGLDFETRIIAKSNAAQRLREALSHPGYEPQALNIGSATDPYQPVERQWRLTRQVIEVLHEARHPFSLLTKSAGIERDLDLIGEMGRANQAAVYVSVTTLDPQLARTLEPRAAAPHRRLRSIEALAKVGVRVGVSVSPVIPFLNEPELERILQAAADAGAQSAFSVVLRLPWEVNPLFQQWLEQHVPERAARIMARVRELRGGRDYDADFKQRMTGQGAWAQLLRDRFHLATRRLGLSTERHTLDASAFRRPLPPMSLGQRPGAAQASLF